MNDNLIKQLVNEFFGAPHRELTVLSWKFEHGRLLIKAKDVLDGLVGIYAIQDQFLGFAKSPDKDNFQVAKK
jgi:hypothetical protein